MRPVISSTTAPASRALPLEMLLRPDAGHRSHDTRRASTPSDLAGIDLSEDVRLLIKTHNSRLWGSPEFHTDYIGVTERRARHLVDHGIKVRRRGLSVGRGVQEAGRAGASRRCSAAARSSSKA